ncbi:MAG: hypothetical protein QOF78_3828 [Phycisphaerales bacterium]|nr:hypothetical protein [Phycisphaerales bacterium]
MNTIALLAVLLTADPPREANPFGAIENRPLWERSAQRDPLTLQQQTEDALDRSNGRIEDEATFELRRIERDRQRPFDLSPRAEEERFRIERDRQERLDERRMRFERDERRQRRLEREADALADARRRWAEQVGRENHAGGAVVDRQGLERVEAEYRAALDAAAKAHAAAVVAIEADAKLTPDERAARRAAADRQLDENRTAAARRWELRRKEVLGQK